MSNVYIEARPQGPVESSDAECFVVQDQHGNVVRTFPTLREAIHWARKNGHAPLVPCNGDLNDKADRAHWRSAYGIVLV